MVARRLRFKISRKSKLSPSATPSQAASGIMATAAFAAFALALPAQGQPASEAPAEAQAQTPRPTVAFTVGFPEDLDPALETVLRDASLLLDQSQEAPATTGQLVRRAEADAARLQKVLQSEGYYLGTVEASLDRRVDPLLVSLAITPGPLFILGSVEVTYADEREDPDRPQSAEALGLTLGAPVTPKQILAATNNSLAGLSRNGYPFAKLDERRVFANPETETIRVLIKLDSGPKAVFGEQRYEGLTRVNPTFIRRLSPWKEGDTFDQSLLPAFDATLEATGLFSTASVRPAGELTPEGQLPVAVIVEERKRRVIRLGAKYSTTDGFGVLASWTHRNLFGYGERLTASADVAQTRRVLSLEYRVPQFTGRRQTAFAKTALIQEESDAFEEESWLTSAGIEKRFSPIFRGSAGVEIDIGRITDLSDEAEGESETQLISLPVVGNLDTTDNLLDPQSGVRVQARLEPHFGLIESETIQFLAGEVSASAYRSLGWDGRLVLAGRTRVASIAGATAEDLPADERYYAGGGGSLRGYGFRQAGPLDDDGDPTGGLSAFEAGLELRGYVTDTIGLVGFIEAGNVYDTEYPDFGSDMLYSAGAGLRYKTPIGPIRVDVAVPLDRRDTDDSFQLYLSIGQAF